MEGGGESGERGKMCWRSGFFFLLEGEERENEIYEEGGGGLRSGYDVCVRWVLAESEREVW